MNRKINRSKFLQKYICVHISSVNMLLFPKMLSALGPPKKIPKKIAEPPGQPKNSLKNVAPFVGWATQLLPRLCDKT